MASQWSYINGRFVPSTAPSLVLPIAPTTAATASAADATTTTHPLGGGTILDGEFVEIDSVTAFTATPRVVPATEGSPVVLGLATSSTPTETKVKSGGVGLAWVIQGKSSLPLSGFYTKSVNGIHTSNVVVDVQGESFTVSATKSKELDELAARFNALTTTTTAT